jgi:transcription antitermination factor NusG
MRIGETVRITEGPFFGMRGNVLRSSGRRAVLAVVFGSREVQIEIERAWVVAATPRRSTSRIENPKPNQRRTG